MLDLQNLKAIASPEIEKAIHSVLQKTSEPVFEMCKYQVSSGGKRIRAFLPVLIAEYFSRSYFEALPISVAAELTHNATLVHDDIQDGDEIRRNRETVWKKFGTPQAINCGNALFHLAFEALAEMKTPPKTHAELTNLLSSLTLKTIEGQAKEFQLTTNLQNISVEKISEIAVGKTSGLFIFPVIATLIAFEKPRTMINKMTTALERLGVVFQMQDDIIDLYGDKGRAAIGNDIKEGKASSLIAYFFKVAQDSDAEKLKLILKKPREITLDSDVSWVAQCFQRYSVKESVEKHIEKILEDVENSLRDDLLSYSLFQEIFTLFKA